MPYRAQWDSKPIPWLSSILSSITSKKTHTGNPVIGNVKWKLLELSLPAKIVDQKLRPGGIAKIIP